MFGGSLLHGKSEDGGDRLSTVGIPLFCMLRNSTVPGKQERDDRTSILPG